MSEEDKHKLSKILYYSDIHPADTEFINNIIYDLQQENQQLKEDKRKAREYIKENTTKQVNHLSKNREIRYKLELFDEKYNGLLEILGDKE